MASRKVVAAEPAGAIVAAAVQLPAAAPAKKKKHARVWSTEAAVQENYRRAIEMFETEGQSYSEKLRSVGEIRQHLTFAAHVLESHFTAETAREFIEMVGEVLDEFDPGLRFKVEERLLAKRVAKAAGVKRAAIGQGQAVARLSGPVGPVDTDEGRCEDAADADPV